MNKLYVVVMDNLEEETEDILVCPVNGVTPLVFTTREAAEAHREELIQQILEEHQVTEKSCPVTRKRGHIFLWDEAECYRITELTLV
jgi:uncharacterized protein YbaR (Trm112 family)